MVNIGIIGAGRIGQVHARSIVSGVPGAGVAKVADPYIKPEVKEWMEATGAEVVSDYHDILKDPKSKEELKEYLQAMLEELKENE